MSAQPDRPAVPDQAVTDAAEAIHSALCPLPFAGSHSADEHADAGQYETAARAVLEAGAETIREAERQRLFGANPDREQAFSEWYDQQPFAEPYDPHSRDVAYEAFSEGWQQAAAKIPHGIIDVKGKITAEEVAELKAKWLAAWEAARGQPLRDLTEADIAPNPYTARIAELERLAADMLSRYAAAGDGHRARVGQVQIGKWETILKGTS